MKHFCLFLNPSKENAGEVAGRVREYLLKHGADCMMSEDVLKKEDLKGSTECVITLGGDGTVIRVAREIAGTDIPIVGINLGHLGYMTGIGADRDIPQFLDALINNDFETEKRMMLSGTVRNGEGAAAANLSLNEIVITRKNTVKAIRLKVSVNGRFLNEYTADGIIIATPTGSTAYNLSAGGPIVDPGARMTILTPICPHALARNSIVLKAEDELDISVPDQATGERIAVFDGETEISLKAGSSVHIRESDLTTSFIKMSGGTFLDHLRSKMTTI